MKFKYIQGTEGRRVAFTANLDEACAMCGRRNRGIEVHHKDHDHTNNDISNLEIRCWRCHAIEHGRKTRLDPEVPDNVDWGNI